MCGTSTAIVLTQECWVCLKLQFLRAEQLQENSFAFFSSTFKILWEGIYFVLYFASIILAAKESANFIFSFPVAAVQEGTQKVMGADTVCQLNLSTI